MEADFKYLLIAAVVIFIISKLIGTSSPTSASAIKNSASIINAPVVQNQIITTQILDSNGRVVQTRQVRY